MPIHRIKSKGYYFMKKLFCVGLIAITALSFVACGGKDNKEEDKGSLAVEKRLDAETSEEDKEIETDLKDDDEINKDKNKDKDVEVEEKEDSDEDINTDEIEIEKYGTKPIESENENEEPKEVNDQKTRVFKINFKNIDYEIVDDEEVITVGYGVAENIEKILEAISVRYFDDKTITLTTIETVGDKKVAVVDLQAEDIYWNQRMQGAAGGQITEHNLIENILQKDYEGYWIDGVRFTVNGKPVEDTGHVPNLVKTSYR